jgi:hypothetical protein
MRYYKLIAHVNFRDEQAIFQKHLDALTLFCRANRDVLSFKDRTRLVLPHITFSELIYLDIPLLLSWADDDSSSVMWEYLFLLSTQVDPESRVKEVLEQMQSQMQVAAASPLSSLGLPSEWASAIPTSTKEGAFLKRFIQLFSSAFEQLRLKTAEGMANPREAMIEFVSSEEMRPLFDMLAELKTQSLDPSQFIQLISSVVSSRLGGLTSQSANLLQLIQQLSTLS